jgi:hypothetical protein
MKSSKHSKATGANHHRKFKSHYKLMQAVGAIEINAMQATTSARPLAMGSSVQSQPTLDVRFLCAALEYPYMFEHPFGDLRIAQEWSAAFTITCMEIDALLGTNKRGFHWRQLDVVEPDQWGVEWPKDAAAAQPRWYWSLGKAYDHQLVVAVDASGPHARIVSSETDPDDALRNAIRGVVERGMRRVLTGNLGPSNEGVFQ